MTGAAVDGMVIEAVRFLIGIPRMSALLLRQDNTCDYVYEGS